MRQLKDTLSSWNRCRRSLSFREFSGRSRGCEHEDERPNDALSRAGPPEFISRSRREQDPRSGHNGITTRLGESIIHLREKRFLSSFGMPCEKRNDPARGETAVRAALSRAKSLYWTHLTCLTVQLPALLARPLGAPMVYLWTDVNPNFTNVRVTR